MGYQTVRALTTIRHNGVLRIPGQTTGVNAQDFVAEDSLVAKLVALSAVTSLGVAAEPLANSGVVRPGIYNLTPTSIAKARMALGKIIAGTKKRMVIAPDGDSTFSGLGANEDTATGYHNAFNDGVTGQLAKALARITGVTTRNDSVWGTNNFVIANYLLANPTHFVGTGTLSSTSGGDGSSSLAGQAFGRAAAGDTVTFSFDAPIDNFEIRYQQNNGVGAATVTVDGGATTFTLVGGSAATSQTINGNGAIAWGKKSFTVARGTHTVTITYQATNLPTFGIDAWDSTLSQIAIWSFGESGATMSNKANTTAPWSELNALAVVAPMIDVLPFNVTINDMISATTLSAYTTDARAVFDTYQTANPLGQLIIMAAHDTDDVQAMQDKRALQVEVLKAEAYARNVPFIDLKEVFGNWAALNALGAYADNRHALKAFYGIQANLIASIITS